MDVNLNDKRRRWLLLAWKSGWPTLTLVVLAIAVSFILTTLLRTPTPAPTASRPALDTLPIDFWDWGTTRTLTPVEREHLTAMGSTQVFSLCGLIDADGGKPSWTPSGRASSPPPGLEQHLVVRLDAVLARIMDPTLGPQLIPLILAGCERNRTSASRGLQIDADVPTRKLAAYAEFLHQLRSALPTGWGLSCTMLLDWARSRDLKLVGEAVDFVAPQFYSAYVPLAPGQTHEVVAAVELERTMRRLEALAVPYRVGLPIFEQCSLFDARGELRKPSLPLSPEAALAAGARAVRVSRGDETTIELLVPAPLQVGNLRMDTGQRLLFGTPTAGGLARQLSVLRGLPHAHCRGVLLYRLPGTEITRTLSITQVAAASSGKVKPASLTWRAEPLGNGHWTMLLSNRGDEDFIDLEHPARATLTATGSRVSLSSVAPRGGHFLLSPLIGGVPGPPTQADGMAIDLLMLRAGATLTVEDVRIAGPPGAVPLGDVRWAAGTTPLERR